jgi:transcriptional antiterminator RfaH
MIAKFENSDSWVVASTHPLREQAAAENLGRQGFHVYYPKIWKRIRHARRLQNVLRPLFPGYVFIRLDPRQEQWRSVDSTFGVRNLIRFGERPGTIPSEFVAGLRLTEKDGAVALPRARDSYAIGDRVRMREGPFEGLIATVLGVAESERITVLMDMLCRSVRVRISLDEVVPA